MHSIDLERRERGTIWQPFPASLLLLGLLFLVFAVLASSHTIFPFFPLFPLVLLFLATRKLGRAAWRGGPPALPTSGISKEKELLEASERHGEITAARAALETSLSVAEAEEMLSTLANNGHVRVIAKGGTLVYALWD